MQVDLAPVPVVPVFKHIDPLPRAQREAAALKWNRELGLCQGSLDMCRHVVGSLGSMPIRAVKGRYSAEKILQVTTDIRIGIFLDGQRCRGVPDK